VQSRNILTRELDRNELWHELEFIGEALAANGHTHCQVLFGAAWGNEYYQAPTWEAEELSSTTLVAKVREVEGRGIGVLGEHDLWIEIRGELTILFCNDGDLHLRSSQASPAADVIAQRWLERGFEPRNSSASP
jgi:hypothetical protein